MVTAICMYRGTDTASLPFIKDRGLCFVAHLTQPSTLTCVQVEIPTLEHIQAVSLTGIGCGISAYGEVRKKLRPQHSTHLLTSISARVCKPDTNLSIATPPIHPFYHALTAAQSPTPFIHPPSTVHILCTDCTSMPLPALMLTHSHTSMQHCTHCCLSMPLPALLV